MNTNIAQAELYQTNASHQMFNLREPQARDGACIHRLIEHCPPLDTNSSYCNYLQAMHFSSTCVAAEVQSEVLSLKSSPELAGFLSGYIKPQTMKDSLTTLFIWQVAVHEDYRGFGLAFQMLEELIFRSSTSDVQQIETTITKDNLGSWQLFRKLARVYGHPDKAPSTDIFLDENIHFNGEHATEYLFQIPLCKNKIEQLRKERTTS